MSPVSGIVRMNIAAMDGETLALTKAAMEIGVAIEHDAQRRDDALEVIELIEAEQNARADRGEW